MNPDRRKFAGLFGLCRKLLDIERVLAGFALHIASEVVYAVRRGVFDLAATDFHDFFIMEAGAVEFKKRFANC